MAGQIKPEPRRRRFHAISIVAGPGGCAHVKALTGVRLLSVEAPRLPIVGCTNPDGCSCRFQHHEDRRAGPRRSEPRKSMRGAVSTDNNRRRSLGRRDVD
ncbi:MAG: hypothetical protein WCF43_11405 [Steroidobacteraceae bacterium]